MLKDPDFNEPYVYTDFYLDRTSSDNGRWITRNETVRSRSFVRRSSFIRSFQYDGRLGFVRLGRNSTFNGDSFHLSRANDESFYLLYDINPSTSLNRLRFCRRDDVRSRLKTSKTCRTKTCQVDCHDVMLDQLDDDLRFGFYVCRPRSSLSGTVVTHSFPRRSDLVRSDSDENHRVAIREPFDRTRRFSFVESQTSSSSSCIQSFYLNRDLSSDQTRRLNCDAFNRPNRTFVDVSIRARFNGLVSIGFERRLITANHIRFIDHNRGSSLSRFEFV